MKVFDNLDIGAVFVLIKIMNHSLGTVLPCDDPGEDPTPRNLNGKLPMYQKVSKCFAIKREGPQFTRKKISSVQAVLEIDCPSIT